ncbi:MAG: hypothetical protein M3Z35_06585, partial [Nitrospirota bacterium]|nr:hypothetical protein [Nitrospirota bacterium]
MTGVKLRDHLALEEIVERAGFDRVPGLIIPMLLTIAHRTLSVSVYPGNEGIDSFPAIARTRRPLPYFQRDASMNGDMTVSLFLGLNPFQWLALILSATTLLIMVDAFVGHYRHSFSYRLQYGPLIAGPLLAVPALMTAALPRVLWLNQALSLSGWLAVATGFI